MRLEPLYRVTFHYEEAAYVEVEGHRGVESRHFLVAEGRVEGRVAGRLRGANHPHRRTDGTYEPDFQGVIETDDGAKVLFDYRGRGMPDHGPNGRVTGFATHLASDERYRWLNDEVAAIAGAVHPRADGSGTDIVLEVALLVWQPPAPHVEEAG